MHPALIAAIALACAACGLVLGRWLGRARLLREQQRRATRQGGSVHLYLSRKTAEAGLELDDYGTKTTFDEILDANHSLATKLLEYDKKQVELGDTQEFGLAATSRLSTLDKKKDEPN